MTGALIGSTELRSLRDYLRVARRRKWPILFAAVFVPLVAVLVALHQRPLYRASAQVLLARQSLASSVNGTPDSLAAQDPDRVAQTEARLARVPTVAERAVASAGVTGRTPRQLLAESTVSQVSNTDLLQFSVTDRDARIAKRLSTAYARSFTGYRQELDTSAIVQARADVQSKLHQLRPGTRLYADLTEKDQQLATLQALQGSNASLVNAAGGAGKVRPRPKRDGLLGLLLGLVLGLVLAFVWEALDSRVRSSEEIGEKLGLSLLGRIPEPPVTPGAPRLVMVGDRDGPQADAFRMLRTNLEFASLERDVRTILVTSAGAGEGKSTTAANLAVALAYTGRHVILVDLDLRRPALETFFSLPDGPGLTHVARGHVDLSRALVPVAITNGKHGNGANGNGRVEVAGTLDVLGAGTPPPDAAEFVASQAVSDILAQLRSAADVVLIDAPPLLQGGDAMALSARVDALLLVTRLRVLRRPALNELRRVLEHSPAAKLGFVVTDSEHEEGGYGYAYYRSSYDRHGVHETERVR